jgi:hypothetical protein
MFNTLQFIVIAFLIFSCSTQPSRSPKSVPQKPTIDTTNNDGPGISDIVEEFRDSVQKETTLDSTHIMGQDTLSVQVKMEVMAGSSYLLPNKYLQEVQLDSFRAWNMTSIIKVMVNGKALSEITLTKDNFAPLLDNSLRKYGILMYPEVDKIDKSGVAIDYSISIPFTDVGIGVVAKVENGIVSYSADQNNPE